MDEKTKEDERKELEKKEADKDKSPPFLYGVPAWLLIAGAILTFFAINNMKKTGGNQIWVIIIIVALIIIFSMRNKPPVDMILSPREAYLYLEREIELKKQWGYFHPQSRVVPTPNADLMHIDERGTHYVIGVTEYHPFDGIKEWIAKVAAKGEEKSFVTFIECVDRYTGREIRHQKNVVNVPEWVKRGKQYPTLERFWGLR